MSIQNAKKRQRLISQFLRKLNVDVEDRNVIIRKEDLVFRFHMFQTNIEVSLPECFQCPLDCNKFVELYLGKTELEGENISDLEKEDLLLLAHIKDIVNDNFPVENEVLISKIKRKIHVLNFGLIGYDQVGKTTLFEMIPGKPRKVENLIQTYMKEIHTFSPLFIRVYDYGTQIMENLTSKSPAPLLLQKLKHYYLYIVVTDSSSQDVMAIKSNILPKLKRLSPYAAIMVIANKQDQPDRISAQLIQKILDTRAYPVSALKPDSEEFFNKLLNEVIILRQEQMREYNCPFLETQN